MGIRPGRWKNYGVGVSTVRGGASNHIPAQLVWEPKLVTGQATAGSPAIALICSVPKAVNPTIEESSLSTPRSLVTQPSRAFVVH
jgi:hypothetical protein